MNPFGRGRHGACVTAFLSLCLLCFAAAPSAQQLDQYGRWVNGVSEPWYFDENMTKDEIAAAQSRWQLLGAQDASASEWEGDYGNGDDVHGSFLRWTPRSGFVVFHVDKCRAAVMHLDYGTASLSASVLRFSSARQESMAKPHSHDHAGAGMIEYVPVKWGGLRFLVLRSKIAAFGEQLAGLGKFNPAAEGLADYDVNAFTKFTNDYHKPATGLPVFPPGFERFVQRPVDAEVTAVGARTVKRLRAYDGSPYFESYTRVRLNVGSADGATRGMRLYVLDSKADDLLKVVRVGSHSSVGVLVRSLDDERQEIYKDWDTGAFVPYPAIRVGWRLSSSIYRMSFWSN